MTLSFRRPLLLTLLAMALSACGNDPAEPGQPGTTESFVDDAVLGSWAVIEEDGAAPRAEEQFVFSAEGELTRTTLSDSMVSLAQYTFVAENQLSVTDAEGTKLYIFTIEDKGMMRLTEPGENGSTLLLQRLADSIQPPPPPTSTDIPEDSLPTDSL